MGETNYPLWRLVGYSLREFFSAKKMTFGEKATFLDFFIYRGFGARDLSKKTRAEIPCINHIYTAPSLPRGVKICKKSLAKGSGPSQHIWAGETTNVHSRPYPRPTRPGKNKCVSLPSLQIMHYEYIILAQVILSDKHRRDSLV